MNAVDQDTYLSSQINVKLDQIDRTILNDRLNKLAKIPGPRVGDYVRFADGVERRIAHDWAMFDGGLQTADDRFGPMTFYLDSGFCSYSGGLRNQVPRETLTLTEETKLGSVWFFHHDIRHAHNGVDVEIPFRVYTCTEDAPQ